MKIELKLYDYQGKQWLPKDREHISEVQNLIANFIRHDQRFVNRGIHDTCVIVSIERDEMELRGWK